MFLGSIRLFGLLLFASSEQYYWNAREDWWLGWNAYYTNWSWYIWGCYSIFVCCAHWLFDIEGARMPRDSTSPLLLWKWCTVLYEIGAVNSFLVTPVFWIAIFPVYPWPMTYFDYVKHIVPFFFSQFELYLNRMVIE